MFLWLGSMIYDTLGVFLTCMCLNYSRSIPCCDEVQYLFRWLGSMINDACSMVFLKARFYPKKYHVKFLPLWICFKLAFRNFLACFIQEVLMSFALGFRKVFVCFIHDELRISHEQCQLVCLCSVLILAELCFALQRKES